MAKIRLIDIPDGERENIFRQISTRIGLPPFAVEKDWWVVQSLSVIFEMEVAKSLVFKGGTSLSKAWNLIKRFSEDIDLAIDREYFGFASDLSKNQRDKLKKTAGAWVEGSFFPDLKTRFKTNISEHAHVELIPEEESDKDRTILIFYPNVIPSPGYLEPVVQIEMSSRSMREPFTIKAFGSLIDEHYPEMDFAQPFIHVPSVNPERTFLEKIFLLHEEFHRSSEKMRVNRLSRHLYDVAKLAKTEFAGLALNDPLLYAGIVDHRYNFTRVGGVNYNLHQPQSINPLPPPELTARWRVDFNKVIEELVYEENPPSFDSILTELTLLKNRINGLPWNFEKRYPEPGIK